MKFDKRDFVKKEIMPLLNKVYDLCEENDLTFFSFVLVAFDEEDESVTWMSSRFIPDSIKEGPIPDSVYVLNKTSAYISDGEE